MSPHDRESIEAIIARADHQRSMAMAEILADGILYVSSGIGKVCRATGNLLGYMVGRPISNA